MKIFIRSKKFFTGIVFSAKAELAEKNYSYHLLSLPIILRIKEIGLKSIFGKGNGLRMQKDILGIMDIMIIAAMQ